MSSAPFWIGGVLSYTWDILVLGTNTLPIVFPGLAKLSGVYEVDYHRGKSQGQDAAAVTDKGAKPRRVNAELRLWNSDHWSQFQDVVAQLNLDASGKSRPAYELGHPIAQVLGIGEVVIEKMEVPAPNAHDGMTVKIVFLEVKKPVPNNPQPPQQPFSQVGLTPLPGSNGTG